MIMKFRKIMTKVYSQIINQVKMEKTKKNSIKQLANSNMHQIILLFYKNKIRIKKIIVN